MTLEESLRQAMIDLRSLDDPYASEMNIVALGNDGTHAGASTTEGKTYIYMTADMSMHVEVGRIHVAEALSYRRQAPRN